MSIRSPLKNQVIPDNSNYVVNRARRVGRAWKFGLTSRYDSGGKKKRGGVKGKPWLIVKKCRMQVRYHESVLEFGEDHNEIGWGGMRCIKERKGGQSFRKTFFKQTGEGKGEEYHLQSIQNPIIQI